MYFQFRNFASLSWLLAVFAVAAAAQCPSGGTTYTGGQGIAQLSSSVDSHSVPVTTQAAPYPATLAVPGTATGTITSLCVTITGLKATGISQFGTTGLGLALKSPSGRILALMGNDSDGDSTLTGVTLNITDSAASSMPDFQQNQDWPSTSGTFTYKPSAFGNGFNDTTYPSLGTLTLADLPVVPTDSQGGTSTLNSRFLGDTPAGTWSLYAIDSSGFAGDDISFTGWSLTMTVSQTNVSTSTTLSSSLNPSFSGGANSSVTLTATVHSLSGSPTGTVAFQDGGNTIPGCGSVALTAGVGTCSTAFSLEGTHSLTATYTASSGFTGSTTNSPLYQYVKHHSTNPSAGLYCNPGVLTMAGTVNGTGTAVYPSVVNVGTDTPSLASSVSTVSVTLDGLSTAGSEGSGPIHALLVSPDGNHTLEFMSGAGDNGSQSAVNVTWSDSGVIPPNYFNSTPLTSTTYQAFSEDTTNVFPATPGNAVPSLPASYNFAEPGGGASEKNFEQAFNGAASDGDWKLFIIDNGGSNTSATISGGWCIQITQASGVATSTSVSSNPNPAIGVPVTVTATIRNANNQTPVTEGAVTFTENGVAVAGGPSAAVAVNGSGVASFTTSSLSQGDHTITASYQDGSGAYNISFGTLVQRVDNATQAPAVSGSTYSYCNTGAIQIPGVNNPSDKGPGYPNPSNIFVTNLPGQTNAVTLTLNNFSHLDPQLVESLVVGPGAQTANTLDFMSGVGGEPGTDNPVNLTFSDAAAGYAPTAAFTAGTYTYKPTSETGNDTFTASASGFYPVPLQIQYAGPVGSHTLNGTYEGVNENGTWSLFFNQSSGSLGGSVGGGWCVNFSQTLPQLTIAKSAVTTGSMAQGQTGFTYNITVGNTGPGSTGGTVSVTDVPSSGLTVTGLSGTGWTCAGSTCSRSDALSSGNSYPTITATVTVAANASSPQTNYATVSGGGAIDSGLHSNTVSTTVLQGTTTTVANASVPFSTASQNVTLSATVSSAGGTVNSGTVTFALVGVSGAASVTSGTVTNGNASVSYTVPANTAAGTYEISATFNPGGAFAGSGDTTHSLTVTNAGTTVVAANASPTFSNAAQNVTLSATVTSASGVVNSGSVTFTVNGIVGSATGNVVNGAASASFSLPAGTASGSYEISATYNAGPNLANNSDTTHAVNILPAQTTTTAGNASVPFSAANQNVTLSATVTSGAGTVNSGTVTFAVSSIANSSSVTSGTVTNGNASVSFVVPAGTPSNSYQIVATYNQSLNYVGSSDTSHTLTVQAQIIPAAVTNLSSTTANGTYGATTVIPIQVTFSKPVTVTGAPFLSLNDNGTAGYVSGSGTTVLTFSYTVATGQNTPLLNATAITLNGGTILDATSTPANLALPASGAAGSLGANNQIAIDTAAIEVVSYSVNYGTAGSYNLVGAARTAHLPWTVTSITVNFSAPVSSADVASLGGITATQLTGLGTTSLTWSFAPITNATLSTTLAGSGPNAIADAYGNTLGGGTGFSQNFSVLYGDFNGDGSVTSTDMVSVNSATKTAYNRLADVNGDGVVSTADVTIVKQQQGATQR